MLNFILGERFSYADLIVYTLAITIATSGHVWSAMGFVITGFLLTTYLELKFGLRKVR